MSPKSKWVFTSFFLILSSIPNYSASALSQSLDNQSARFLVPIKYDRANDFAGGFAVVQLGKKIGFIDATGKVVVPIKYDGANKFAGGFAQVQIGEKWGFIDVRGKVVVPIKYDGANDFAGGFAVVKLGQKYGYINLAP